MSCFQIVTRMKAFFKNQPRIKQQLAIMYKKKFQHTIFYDVCQSSLRFINAQSSQYLLDQDDQNENLPFDRPTSRKSVTAISHYQNSNIRFSLSKQEDLNSSIRSQPPNTIQYMSINQKQQLLKQLIQKSYLFIDISDLFSGQDLETYQHLVKKQVFEGQESIVQSILQNSNKKNGVKNKLKYFDTQALHLLKIYVDFCEDIMQKLKPVSQEQNQSYKKSFLQRLLLQLKARLQFQFPDQRISKNHLQLKSLVHEYRLMNDIILCTLSKTQKISILPQDSNQYAQNFFTYQNISTLVSVILFKDQNFLKAMFGRFLQGLKICAGRMSQKLNLPEQIFLQQLRSTFFGIKLEKNNLLGSKGKYKTQDLFTYKSNVLKILDGSSNPHETRSPFFKKSLRTLQTLSTQKQPIKSLKIIYELNKTIQKEHQQYINMIIQKEKQYQTQRQWLPQNGKISQLGTSRQSYSQQLRLSKKSKKYSFSRETECLIIEFLLSKKKQKLRFIISNIMMTYWFVHENMLKDKKGSCLMPFVEIIENYGEKG